MPQFEKFMETEEAIRSDEEYIIPSFPQTFPQKATHVGVRKGRIAFFCSKSNVVEYKSKGRGWHYWLIPNGADAGGGVGAKSVVFLTFQRGIGGYDYGHPLWHF
ncbi:MAG: hypothetical protein U9P63_03135 [Patescibacteria group bacterium]|nr:hypothetical protein [Patescibacteria group bacterium]